MFQNLKNVGAQILLVALVVNLTMSAAVAGENYPVKVGQKVRVTTPGDSIAVKEGIVAGIDGGKLFITSQGEMRIDRVTTNDGVAFNFPYIGATYDPESRTVTGMTGEGTEISILLDDVSYADVMLIVKDKQIPLKFDASAIYDRLEFEPDYSKLVWQGSVDSIEQLQVWQKSNRGTLVAIGVFSGISIGIISGMITYENEKSNSESWFSPSVMGKLAGVVYGAVGIFAGVKIANAVAHDGKWVDVPEKKFRVNVGMIGESGLGVSLALKF